VLKLAGGRVIHDNDVIPEERVGPPVFVESEDDRPIVGLGDLVEIGTGERTIRICIRMKLDIHGHFEVESQPFPNIISKRGIQRAHEELVLVYVTFEFPE